MTETLSRGAANQAGAHVDADAYAKAADFLRSVGFKHVLNLKGGILDWVDKVDPSQPKY